MTDRPTLANSAKADGNAAAEERPLGLAERIAAILALEPQRRALEFKEQWHSWQAVSSAMERIESLLVDQGAGEGAPIAVLIRNRPAHVAALLQVVRSRRCIVMMNPFQSPANTAADLQRLNVAALIADAEDAGQDSIRQVILERNIPIVATGGEDALAIRLAHAPPKTKRVTYESHPGVAIRMLTSGTTGTPKRIDLSYENFERALLDALFYEPGASQTQVRLRDAVVIAMTPLVHIGGLWAVVAAVLSGRSISLMEKFSLPEWRRAVVTHRPKVVGMPPTALRMVYDANVPREELSSVLAIRSGTAALPLDLQEAFEDRYGIPILDTYGATEFAGAVAGWTIADHKAFARSKRGSAGRAQPGCELRIVDRETFAVLQPGQLGLLEVRAPRQMGPDWIRTNDLAEIDADGFLFIRGRADDAIVRGGFKVSPGEITKVLLQHPAVKDAGVVGLPDARLGAVPVAAVELRVGAVATEAELLAFLREKLVAYQMPTQLKILPALPRTPSLKVSQPQLRELFEPSP